MEYAFLCLAIALLIVYIASRPRPTPTRCKCGNPASVVDDDQPWKAYCSSCHVKRLRKKGEPI